MTGEKGTVTGFLRLCVRYAEDSLKRKQTRIGTDDERPEDVKDISAWESYRDFTARAVFEVESGELDSWFEHLDDENWRPQPDDSSNNNCTDESASKTAVNTELTGNNGIGSIDLAAMDYLERRTILDGVISPRPIVLASTRSGDGIDNLSGLSSLALVSNHPPQIALSLSQDREGRRRDTFLNLVETGKITLHVLPSSRDMAELIDAASQAIAPDKSEWELLDYSPQSSPSQVNPNASDWPAILPLASAALECELLEVIALPEGAVAQLCLLAVRNIIAPPATMSALKSGQALNSLCQHGSYRLTPAPNSWSFDCSP